MNIHNARSDAISTARQLMDHAPLFLDTETTGIDNNAEIVEIAIVDYQGEVVYDSLVKPVHVIPPDAIKVHGITNEDVLNAPSWPETWPHVRSILENHLVGMYNSEYDIRLMQQSCKINNLPWEDVFESFCVMKLFAQFAGEWNEYRQSFRWFSLEKAAIRCDITLPTLHRAAADTSLTRSVFLCIGESTPTLF